MCYIKISLLSMACALASLPSLASSLDMQNEKSPLIKLKVFTGHNNIAQSLYSDIFYTKHQTQIINEPIQYKNDSSIFGMGIEAEFTEDFGAEIRQYFGSDSNSPSLQVTSDYTNNEIENFAAMTNATALLLNYQTPKFYGINGYAHIGVAATTNKVLDTKLESIGFAYGFGLEYSLNKDLSIYMDSLILNPEDYKYFYTNEGSISKLEDDQQGSEYYGEIKNSLYSFGIVFKF